MVSCLYQPNLVNTVLQFAASCFLYLQKKRKKSIVLVVPLIAIKWTVSMRWHVSLSLSHSLSLFRGQSFRKEFSHLGK